jgi:hypothetical protein
MSTMSKNPSAYTDETDHISFHCENCGEPHIRTTAIRTRSGILTRKNNFDKCTYLIFFCPRCRSEGVRKFYHELDIPISGRLTQRKAALILGVGYRHLNQVLLGRRKSPGLLRSFHALQSEFFLEDDPD